MPGQRGRPRKDGLPNKSVTAPKNPAAAGQGAEASSSSKERPPGPTKTSTAPRQSNSNANKGKSADRDGDDASGNANKEVLNSSAVDAVKRMFQFQPRPSGGASSTGSFPSPAKATPAAAQAPSKQNCNNCALLIKALIERVDHLEDTVEWGLDNIKRELQKTRLADNAAFAGGMGSNPFTSLKRAAVHDSFGDVLPAGNTSSTKMGKFASKRARTAAPDNLVDGVSVVEVDEEPRTFPIGRVSTIEEAWQQWNIPSDALPIPLKDWTTQMISDNPQKMVYYQRRALCKEIERLGSVEIFKTIHGNTLTGAGESVRERNLAEGKSKRRTKKGAKNAQNDDAAAMADVSAADVSTAPANGNYSLYDEDDDDEDDEDERIAASGVMSAPRTSSRQQQRIQQQQQQAPQQSPTTSFIPTTGQANTRQPQQQQQQQQQQQPFATHHHQGYQTSVASHHNHTNTLNSQQAAVAAQSLLNHSRLPGPPTHHGGGSANSGGGSGSASHHHYAQSSAPQQHAGHHNANNYYQGGHHQGLNGW